MFEKYIFTFVHSTVQVVRSSFPFHGPASILQCSGYFACLRDKKHESIYKGTQQLRGLKMSYSTV